VQELQRQLDKVGGKDVGSEEGTGSIPELYPSIRELPLLGVKYADLYRNVKVQEAVFETLTKQYEMAKVAEAKELPTVKVLDSPQVAEKRSSPPRLMIVILGSLFGFFLGASWLVMEARTGPSHPVRILLAELSDQMRELSARHFRKHRPMDSSR
jgi:capsule polysaccharide export protein KpsE/RkpR